MIVNQSEVRDSIVTLFKTAWDAQTAPIPKAFYDDINYKPPKDTPYARVQVEESLGTQRSLGSTGNRFFSGYGIVTISVFTPVGNGVTLADRYVNVAWKAFLGKTTPEGIQFLNTRRRDIGVSGEFLQTKIIADYVYDTIA